MYKKINIDSVGKCFSPGEKRPVLLKFMGGKAREGTSKLI